MDIEQALDDLARQAESQDNQNPEITDWSFSNLNPLYGGPPPLDRSNKQDFALRGEKVLVIIHI